MATFSILTLGCKVNQSESETLERDLVCRGCRPAGKGESAEICIINTCAVTQKAAMQSRQMIRQAIRTHPSARIIVTGCYAQTDPSDIEKIAGVHEIVGHDEKLNIPGRLSISSPAEDRSAGPDLRMSSRSRPFLKIQDGCNAFCTYCIVPYSRGRSRSLPVESVLSAIAELSDNGYLEIVLTGIHLGQYGMDLIPRTSLLELLKTIEINRPMTGRIRLSSIEPAEITDDLIQMVADSPLFCHHFHIPLQSGDSNVLKRMNRPYSREYFQDLVCRIHRTFPDAAIGADVLIGFPGEDDTAFMQTLTLLEELPLTYLHVFPFSARKGTPACHFPGQVPQDVIKSRCHTARSLGKSKKMAFYLQQIGKSVTILIERNRDETTGYHKGMTSNYIPVMVDAPVSLCNQQATVRIVRLHGENAMFGELQQNMNV